LVINDASTAEAGKILYIEDNLSNLTLVEQMLAEQPRIELLTAMQGGLGLDLARQHCPDLILLDLHLPDLRGHEVLARLRQDKVTRDIPVVVISADATARQIQRLMAAGAQSYLTKPLDIAEFFRVVDETMRNRHRHLEAAVA
jgi:CheY-like chemotaxis protein